MESILDGTNYSLEIGHLLKYVESRGVNKIKFDLGW